jgi:hypothetical protein
MVGVHPHRGVSERFFEELGEACLRRTFADVAAQYDVDESTLTLICKDYASRLEGKAQFDVPQTLGISALTYQGKTHALIVDIGQGAPYDLLKSPTGSDLERYLDAMLDPDLDEPIHTVVIDANDAFRDCIEAVLPSSLVVLAPTKLRQLARGCVDEVKREVFEGASRTQRTHLAKANKFLGTPRSTLNVHQKIRYDLLASPAEKDEGLRRITTAYDKAEDFMDIYEANSQRLAETKARQWLHSMPAEIAPAFKPLEEALRKWWEPILDWHSAEVTEEQLHPVRTLVNETNAEGRGYSFEILRAKLLFYPPRRSRHPLRSLQQPNQPMVGYVTTASTSTDTVYRPTHRGPRIVDLLEHLDAIIGSGENEQQNG